MIEGSNRFMADSFLPAPWAQPICRCQTQLYYVMEQLTCQSVCPQYRPKMAWSDLCPDHGVTGGEQARVPFS